MCDFALDFRQTHYFIMHIIFAFFVADFVSRVDLRGIKIHLGRQPLCFRKATVLYLCSILQMLHRQDLTAVSRVRDSVTKAL